MNTCESNDSRNYSEWTKILKSWLGYCWDGSTDSIADSVDWRAGLKVGLMADEKVV